MIKLIVEILLAIFLHPIAFVLCVVDIVNRTDLSGLWKVLWIIISFFWGIRTILYILLGRGKCWYPVAMSRPRWQARLFLVGHRSQNPSRLSEIPEPGLG